jgi:hypothetical protein
LSLGLPSYVSYLRVACFVFDYFHQASFDI